MPLVLKKLELFSEVLNISDFTIHPIIDDVDDSGSITIICHTLSVMTTVKFQNYSLPPTACFSRLQCARLPFPAAIYGDLLKFPGTDRRAWKLSSSQWTGAVHRTVHIQFSSYTIHRYSPIFIIHLGNSFHVLIQHCHILNGRCFLQDSIFNPIQGANFSLVNVVLPFKIVK